MFRGLDMSTEMIKKIVSTFLKKDVDSIDSNTCIDKSAIPGSVLLHRMYSELSKSGFTARDPSRIKTFGELENELFGNEALSDNSTSSIESNYIKRSVNTKVQKIDISTNGIGIDIESSSKLPNTVDYFEDQFYIDNFSKSEIAYCSAKLNPKSCFTGRFSAKEAIVKADNAFINTKFSDIEIKVSNSGSPLFDGMNISISHLNVGDVQISTAIAQKQYFSDNKDSAEVEASLPIKNDLPNDVIPDNQRSKKPKYSLILILIIVSALFFYINSGLL
jgi:phosphopantetheine--protein transferase-like protein